MDPRHAQLLISALILAREGLRQLDIAKLDSLPPELRQQLLDERKKLLDEWTVLAPS